MVLTLGLSCWVLALVALARILRATPAIRPVTARRALPWAILLGFAVALLFRPHEDIFGGQDPGAYLNSAGSFARQGTLFHTDPLLARLPLADRKEFFYGGPAFGLTKDACLWVRDVQTARIGPWFQPAYSIMMSPVAAIAPAAVLYVAPLLALLTGLVLACLASRLVALPWAAAGAFLLYVLMPVIAWNARAPRAELGAAFFLYAGWALILGAWQAARWPRRLDLITGAVCLGVAPFFHITAWYPVIASFAILAALALTGRADFLPAIPVALLAVGGFVAQTRYVTDCYYIWRFLAPILARGWILAPLLAAGVAAVVLLALKKRPTAPSERWPRARRLFGVVMATLPPLLALAIGLSRRTTGQLPFLGVKSAGYLASTDFRGLVTVSSALAAGMAVAGWVWLTWPRPAPRAAALPRLVFLAALLPGLLLTGWMNDYMMETRRMLIVPAPLMALCCSALLAAGFSLRDFRLRLAAATAGGLLILTLVAHKTHLYAATEYRHLYDFLKPFAQTVQREHGRLLVEYSRLAAPFEHFFGIPLLALDSDRRTDYGRAVKAWARLMREDPAPADFLLTPYPDPISADLEFIPVMQASYHGRKLPAAHGAIPPGLKAYDLELHLYRIIPKTVGLTPARGFNRSIHAGNMGQRRFDRVMVRSFTIRGVSLPPAKDVTLAWPAPRPADAAGDLLMFFHTGADAATPPAVAIAIDAATPTRWTPLAEGWWVAALAGIPNAVTSAVLRSSARDALFFDLQQRTPAGARPVAWEASEARSDRTLRPAAARWARSEAQLLLPIHPDRLSDVYLLLKLDEAQPQGGCSLWINYINLVPLELLPGQWSWRCFAITPGGDPLRDRLYLSFVGTPPWNPKRAGFADDLATLIGSAVVAPARDPSPATP